MYEETPLPENQVKRMRLMAFAMHAGFAMATKGAAPKQRNEG